MSYKYEKNSNSYKVNNYSFNRDAAQFILSSGELYFIKPINGRTIGAFF